MVPNAGKRGTPGNSAFSWRQGVVTGSLRVVVVDVNTGHMGSMTVLTAALEAMR